MTTGNDQREAPLSVRLNGTRRKQTDRAAKRAGMTRNAYITYCLDRENARVLGLSSGVPRAVPGQRKANR